MDNYNPHFNTLQDLVPMPRDHIDITGHTLKAKGNYLTDEAKKIF